MAFLPTIKIKCAEKRCEEVSRQKEQSLCVLLFLTGTSRLLQGASWTPWGASPRPPACGCNLNPLGMIIEATNGTPMAHRDCRPNSGRRPVVSHLGRPQRNSHKDRRGLPPPARTHPHVGLLWALLEGLQQPKEAWTRPLDPSRDSCQLPAGQAISSCCQKATSLIPAGRQQLHPAAPTTHMHT